MKSTRAAIRYARALILESAEADSLELIHDDMLVLTETFDHNVELKHMVDSLVIKNSVKLASLKLIFKNLSQITLKLIDVLSIWLVIFNLFIKIAFSNYSYQS